METVKFTNEGDIISEAEIKGRGVSKICTNLAGEHCYSATAKARVKIIQQYNCMYENGNGQLVPMINS